MTQSSLQKLFYMYVAPFGLTISYSYSWLIVEEINRYFFKLDSTDFWTLFNGLLLVGSVISIAGIRFAKRNGHIALKVIYVFLLIISIGLLILIKAIGSMGTLIA